MIKTKIALIGVSYNSDPSAIRFIEGLSTLLLDDVEFTIILVDNTERHNSEVFFNQIHAKNKHVICIKAQDNLGYFGGARLGLSTYLEKNEYPDWLIISNVDIEFRDPKFLQILKACSNIENIGVIAPAILSIFSQRDINPKIFKRPSKRKMKFYKQIFSNYYLMNCYGLLSAAKFKTSIFLKGKLFRKQIIRDNKGTRYSTEKWSAIYAPHGSCIIFSKVFFLRGGSLNYPQFLFNEEIFVGETTRKLGLKVIYFPKLKVIDEEHISTGIIRSRRIASYVADSAKFVADTFFK